MCLGQNDAADLRAPLRESDSNEALVAEIRRAIARKPKGHDFDYSRQDFGTMGRHMSVTGG
jgi:cyclic pyranopterin phosphate synthase